MEWPGHSPELNTTENFFKTDYEILK